METQKLKDRFIKIDEVRDELIAIKKDLLTIKKAYERIDMADFKLSLLWSDLKFELEQKGEKVKFKHMDEIN